MFNLKIVMVLVTFSVLVNAENFCVSNSSELLAAIQTANSNGEDDLIQLKNGDYSHPDQLPFYISHVDKLEISGGWRDIGQLQCISQTLGTHPMDTTIDGNGQSTVLFFTYNDNIQSASVKISNLTIANGYTTVNGIASGLQMVLPKNHIGEVVIDRVYFVGNHSVHRSAVSISRAATTMIKNSVFQFNKNDNGEGTVYIAPRVSNSDFTNGVYFINNTVLFNSHEVESPKSTTSSGLKIVVSSSGNTGAEPKAWIANNLFWDNETYDIFTIQQPLTVYFYNNNYQSFFGHVDYTANNMSVNPMLSQQLLDFTPQPDSPLIDQGMNAPTPSTNPPPFEQNWDYGNTDFDGDAGYRVINGRVDIGAVEAPPEIPIFKNGFE